MRHLLILSIIIVPSLCLADNVQLYNKVDVRSSTTTPIIVSLSGNELDAFRRIRTSDPTTLFDNQTQYDTNDVKFDTFTVSGGSQTHYSNQSSVGLYISTTSGSRFLRQTHGYIRYQPGKSTLFTSTGRLNAPQANVIRRVGIFDDYNGAFFEQTSDGLFVVIRSSTSGVVVDTRISSSSFSLDKLDGSGPSKSIFDHTKVQIFVIDAQWLGSGLVRYGLYLNGKLQYIHEIQHSNVDSVVYSATFNLPVRFEISNSGVTSSVAELLQICTVVLSEGGFEQERGEFFSASRGTSTYLLVASTNVPVLSIRPKLTYGTVQNRAAIVPFAFSLFTSENVYFEIIYKANINTGTWIGVNNNSAVEYNITANTVSGGIVIDSGYLNGTSLGNRGITDQFLPANAYKLATNYEGTIADILTIRCYAVTGTPTVGASFTWIEHK